MASEEQKPLGQNGFFTVASWLPLVSSPEVLCCLAELIQVKSATLQRFQPAFNTFCPLRKIPDFIPFFKTLPLLINFPYFFQVWKSSSQISDFFKNSRLCMNPVNIEVKDSLVSQFPKQTWTQRKHLQISKFVLKASEPCYNYIDTSKMAYFNE